MLLGLTLVFAVAFAAACDPEIPGCASASAAPTPCNAADPSATSCSTGKCDVTINGKTYCSQCTTGKVPVNGECKTKSDATLCTAGSGSAEGTCTACTGSQKLYKGGCYDTCPYGDGQTPNTCADAPAAPTPCNAADPSATSCSTGKCDVTINGKTYCSQCTTGKVPVNGECKTKSDATLCTAGSGSAEGTCTACTGSQKLYKGGCYDTCPYGDGQTPNTCADAPVGGSDPNLSTGAIAGISVAAVVVVGGLVGFLCWWFLCRGKA